MSENHTEQKTIFALHGIALFEAFKGTLAISIGILLLFLGQDRLQDFGQKFLFSSSVETINQVGQLFSKFMNFIAGIAPLWIVIGTVLYAALRFAEAYGLWKDRAWAEWLAIISTAAYLPIEIFDLIEKATLLRGLIVIINLGVLLFLFWVRFRRPTAVVIV